MKKLILIIAIPLNMFAQSDTIYITKSVDEMTDKTYHYINKRLILSEDDKSKGLIIDPTLSDDLKGIRTIYVKCVGLGGCNEKDEMILLFEGGDKVTLISWKDFNCKGEAYFKADGETNDLLKTKKLLKVRFTNGRSMESYTKEVPEKKQSYFISAYKAMDTGDIREAKGK